MSGHPAGAEITLRDVVRTDDEASVRAIVCSTGFFRPAEAAIAVELVEERLRRGAASGYRFVFADQAGRTVAYVCYGPIAGTAGSFDLYWIAVRRDCQGRGLGRRLFREVERRVRAAGGRRIYVETSGREAYAPTRAFYARCGCVIEAQLPDFYDRGDGKVIYCRKLEA